MMNLRLAIIQTVIFGGAFAFGSSNIMAQTFGLEYDTEWQTDVKGKYDWLNLLKLSAEAPVYRGLSLQASTISTAKIGDGTLADDLLTYSNIEADNIPLTFSRLGFALAIGSIELFAGINNVNEDYFTSEMTSFFTNSCCGISPTISCNFDIANYPLAAWCLHYRQQIASCAIQTSIYPGKGGYRLAGHANLFSLDIRRDGIFSITSIDYKRNGIYTVLGAALHYGMRMGDGQGEQGQAQAPSAKKVFAASPWILSEISLPHDLGLLLHGSISTVRSGCRGYAGIGMVYDAKHARVGAEYNYASFASVTEHTAEVSCRLPLFSGHAYLQPAMHIVKTGSSPVRCVAILRFSLSL